MVKAIAREIERLAPAVNEDARPDNTEYPWDDGRVVVAPCDYTFPNLDLTRATSGVHFLKLLRIALEAY